MSTRWLVIFKWGPSVGAIFLLEWKKNNSKRSDILRALKESSAKDGINPLNDHSYHSMTLNIFTYTFTYYILFWLWPVCCKYVCLEATAVTSLERDFPRGHNSKLPTTVDRSVTSLFVTCVALQAQLAHKKLENVFVQKFRTYLNQVSWQKGVFLNHSKLCTTVLILNGL